LRREKFFARGKIFTKNVLHNSNKFVQLGTSDSGVRAFQTAIEHDTSHEEECWFERTVGMRVTGSYRGMVAGFPLGDVGCEY
jgi:hypothetical protein